MRRPTVFVAALVLSLAVLSGCTGKDTADEGPSAEEELDPANFGSTLYDRAVGSQGFRITGSLDGNATPLAANASAHLDIADSVKDDLGGALDKATFVLDASTSGFSAVASLRQMTTGKSLNLSADLFGGVAQNVDINGDTGVGVKTLPKTKAVLFAAGLAAVKIGGRAEADERLVFVAVTRGLRDEAQKPLNASDDHDLELHVLFPGPLVAGNPALGVIGGFVYVYFEKVTLAQLTAEQKAAVGKDLTAASRENRPPKPVPVVEVGGQATSRATKEGDAVVTVRFNASASTDEDGTISSYVWRIFEMASDGTFQLPENESQRTRTGRTADYFFTEAGPKIIELVVRDDQGRIANDTKAFYIDHHFTTNYSQPGPVQQAPGAGGGPVCTPNINCKDHDVRVRRGVESARLELTPASGTVLQLVNLSLYKPGDPPPNSNPAPTPVAWVDGTVLDVAKGNFSTAAGSYRLWVRWGAGVDIDYALDVRVLYTPALPGDGVA